MASEAELKAQLKLYGEALDARVPEIEVLDRYYDGQHPAPPLIQRARLTRAYQTLMGLTVSNWPKLVVDSVEERLEIQGIRFGGERAQGPLRRHGRTPLTDPDALKGADDDAWRIWQENNLDAESSLLHQTTLVDGRAHAIVWGDGGNPIRPRITLEHPSLCIIGYDPGTRQRRAALRRWYDAEAGTWYANLFRLDGLYKFQSRQGGEAIPSGVQGWDRREVGSEPWPLPNPFGRIPVVEARVNGSLKPSLFGRAAGEFETNMRHIDRINYKIFCGLVALTWSGFPLRALIGDPILKDDEGKAIQPFDALVDSIVQLENPDAKLMQLPEASIENYSPEMDIKHLAALTKTPAHYLLGEMVNLSADAIRAAEAALVAKARRHMRALGEFWEEVTRLGFLALDPLDARGRDSSAQVIWADPESRSMAERADAASKLNGILPWQALASKILGATPQEIARWGSERAGEQLAAQLAARAAGITPGAGAATQPPAMAGSGNGAVAG